MNRPGPLFSVLTPVYDPPLDALASAIESVRGQTLTDWELILVNDCSPNPAVRVALAAAAESDPRIRVITHETNGGISASSQTALDAAEGEFVGLLDHDDCLDAGALAFVAAAIAANPEVDYIYTDEDKLDLDGNPFDTFAKPSWSPERLRSQMYTGHLSVLRTALVREVGGFRPGYDGSQDHDLVLRVTERARQIVHVPEVLYHWRLVPGSTAVDTNAKPYGWKAGRRAVDDQLRRVGIAGVAVRGDIPGTYRVHRELDPATTVSVIIPTRGGSGMVWGRERCFVVEAVRSALANTAHPNVEIVVVADTSTPPAVLRELDEIAGDRLVLVDFAEPFNFSRKCNAGYLAARGDVLLFLNDDIEVITDGWLEALVAPLAQPDVGLVGAKLLYSDGSVQHGGHLYERHGFTHAFLGHAADSRAGFSALQLDREVMGVTAACVAIRRETFARVGGFCAGLPGNFNDVDFCFKIRKAGFRILALAQVELFHFESRTRETRVHAWEEDIAFGRWGSSEIDEYLPHRSGRLGNPPSRPPQRRLNGYRVNAEWPPA